MKRVYVALLATGLTVAASAQTYLPREAGSTANSWDRPAPDTPIPSYYQDSYQAYLKMKAAAHGGTEYHRATYEKMPDWSGLWSRAPNEGLKFDPKQPSQGFKLGPVTADLTPRYKAAYEEKLRQVAAGNEWDQLSDCLPAGYPRWLTEPFLREFIVTPSETWWVNEQQSEARRIYTDGRGHIPDAEAKLLWDAASIGSWKARLWSCTPFASLMASISAPSRTTALRRAPSSASISSTTTRSRMRSPCGTQRACARPGTS